MAFFKFRLPGQSPAITSDAHVSAAGESLETIRRRARHRLMGAVVLVFVAVVAFPLLFDSQPRPVSVDTPILIPDRQSTPPLTAGASVPPAQAPAKPLLPAASAAVPAPVPAQASLEPGKEEVVPAAAPIASAASAPAAQVAPALSSPKDKARAETAEKPAPKAADEGQKARALLEGKAPPTDAAQRLVIQVGAFTDADKIREVRRKLEQAGLKNYTQTIDGKDGKRTTRIRVGPFDSRAEADKAQERVRKLGLPVNLISL